MPRVEGKSPYEPAEGKLPPAPAEGKQSGDQIQGVFDRVVRPPAPPVGRFPQAPARQAPRVPVGRGHTPVQ